MEQLACDICGAPMKQETNEFDCTKCQQKWWFDENGDTHCIILARLYPSNMNPKSEIYNDFLTYKLKEFIFRRQARVLCGYITEEQANAAIVDATREIEEARYRPAKTWRERVMGIFRREEK